MVNESAVFQPLKFYCNINRPGRIAQSVVRLAQEPEVPGSYTFMLPLIQEGQLSVTGESM